MNNLPSPFEDNRNHGGTYRSQCMSSPNTPPFLLMNRPPFRSPHSPNFSSPGRAYNIRTSYHGIRNSFRGRTPHRPYSRLPRNQNPYINSQSHSPTQGFQRRNPNSTPFQRSPLRLVPIDKFISSSMTSNPWDELERECLNQSSNLATAPQPICKDSETILTDDKDVLECMSD